MDTGVADTVKDHKRQHDDDDNDDDEDPSARPNQGKKTKRRRTKESESAKKPSTTKETSKGKAPSKISKTGNSVTAKEPIKEPTTEVEMDDAVNTNAEDVINNLTQDLLLRPANNLLKGMCSRSIELEYNFQECLNSLTYKLDWNNPEGNRYPFDMSKPLPLKGHPGYLTVAADYFFNNDLEYLKSSNPERTYTTSITKTKATRYEIVGIEYMVPTL
ncbi:hypothetical protein Tco_1508317 [Tanacetum coccineum]